MKKLIFGVCLLAGMAVSAQVCPSPSRDTTEFITSSNINVTVGDMNTAYGRVSIYNYATGHYLYFDLDSRLNELQYAAIIKAMETKYAATVTRCTVADGAGYKVYGVTIDH